MFAKSKSTADKRCQSFLRKFIQTFFASYNVGEVRPPALDKQSAHKTPSFMHPLRLRRRSSGCSPPLSYVKMQQTSKYKSIISKLLFLCDGVSCNVFWSISISEYYLTPPAPLMGCDMRFPTMWYVRQAYAQSDQSICKSVNIL